MPPEHLGSPTGLLKGLSKMARANAYKPSVLCKKQMGRCFPAVPIPAIMAVLACVCA